MNDQRLPSADFLDDCAIDLVNLHALLRRQFSEEQWAALFKQTDTPEQIARKLLDRASDERFRKANFWTMLDLSTGHLRKGDFELLETYRGVDEDGERDGDFGQSLYVTLCPCGWIISTSGCLAPAPDRDLSPSARIDIEERRAEKISEMRAEGFSEEFVALFTHACENGVTDIRFHADASDLPGFPIFDLMTDEREEEYDVGVAPGPAP
ncbi:hypothetical protein DWF00_27230 [Bosea caraganae]|uniref:DUF5983 domain-containing protein n=1 Tax=Bosea caraganae TaxID=2763117 RepID=A0A370L9S6_9HYPH|nr:hypothetical protein [Bosea caraganae]RDJ22015.1 hypothetical protein DWF00_27230 [Bosea caraganae]RDJ27951.1 hypothetical protein DWE98_04925 [Bosea caraganae]